MILAWVIASAITADVTDRRAQLEVNRTLAVSELRRIEKGAEPCFSDSCQARKYQILEEIYSSAEDFPHLLPSLEEGLDAAHELTARRYEPMKLKDAFPSSWDEWVYFWNKRYSPEMDLRSRWLLLESEIALHLQAVVFYNNLLKLSPNQQSLIQEAFDRGLFEIADLDVRQQLLMEQATLARSQGDSQKEMELRTEAAKAHQRTLQLEESFGGSLPDIFLKLFGSTNYEETLSALIGLKKWVGKQPPFSPAVRSLIAARAHKLRDLFNLTREWNDLERGVVGLLNFYSLTNPAINAEQELIVQGFLDQVDKSARHLVNNLGLLTAASWAGPAIMGPHIVARIGSALTVSAGMGAMSYYQIDWSSSVWEKSNRHLLLSATLESLQEKMQNRLDALWVAQKATRNKINQLDNQIKALEAQSS